MRISSIRPVRKARRLSALLGILCCGLGVIVVIAIFLSMQLSFEHSQNGISVGSQQMALLDRFASSSRSSYDRKGGVHPIYSWQSKNNSTSKNQNLWDESTVLPGWMKEYFEWHASQRSQLNQDNWNSTRYMMLQCLPGSQKCGGTADRLMPLPFMILVAWRSRRLLLIKWGRPTELEEFLLPPQGGMDWRVPSWLFDAKSFRAGPRATDLQHLLDLTQDNGTTMVKVRFQSHDHGADFYNQKDAAEATFRQVYHDCWRVVFTPSPKVAELIQEQLVNSNLGLGQYVGIHVRALYAVQDREPELVQLWTQNAIHCASQLRPGYPIYFASDSSYAIKVAMEYMQHQRNNKTAVRILTRKTGRNQPFHLDKARSFKASDFYDTFVDLYMLANARCITYNMGGYGIWASHISFDSSCFIKHQEASTGVYECDWVDSDGSRHSWDKPSRKLETPIFLPPKS